MSSSAASSDENYTSCPGCPLILLMLWIRSSIGARGTFNRLIGHVGAMLQSDPGERSTESRRCHHLWKWSTTHESLRSYSNLRARKRLTFGWRLFRSYMKSLCRNGRIQYHRPETLHRHQPPRQTRKRQCPRGRTKTL